MRLAEMKWRYRVVEKGQSPRDEGLKLLYAAKALLVAHRAHEANAALLEGDFAAGWAAELSAVAQGLGVTGLIFDYGKGSTAPAAADAGGSPDERLAR